MSIIVRMAGSLRQVTGKAEVELAAKDVAACMDKLESQFAGVKEQLYDEEGELHRFIDVFVNGDNVRSLRGLATPLKDGDEVNILPAFAGG